MSKDRFERNAPRSWASLRQDIEDGREPSERELELVVSSRGVPADMGEYVVKRLSEKRRRARSSEGDLSSRTLKAVHAHRLAWEVAFFHSLIKAEQKQSLRAIKQPRQRALEKVCDAYGEASPQALDQKIKRGRRIWLALKNEGGEMHRYFEGSWPDAKMFEKKRFAGFNMLRALGMDSAALRGTVASELVLGDVFAITSSPATVAAELAKQK